MNSKVSYAVAAILSSASFAAQAADTDSEAVSGSLEEITVTAQRRNESIQNVPIAMQAFTAESLQQLNVNTLDDYIKYLPNVTTANNGPGQNEVFMRGLSAGSQPSQGSASTGLWPNVAIYLDNQSGQLPNRNLDIYAADLNRIEVLEGPQGTLYGAGAEAGVIRYITNEPKLDKVEANVKGGYSVTAHGDPNTDLTAVLNLPIIENVLGVRGVIYNDSRGGYIDNVPATFTRKNTDVGIHYAGYPADANGNCPDGLPNAGFCVPPGSQSISNSQIAGRAINPVTYKGARAEVCGKINDDWDALITQSYQNMDSKGVFYQQPTASDGAPLQSAGSHPVQQLVRQGQVREHRPGPSTASSASSRPSTPAATWCATSSRSATTPTMRAASTPITTSASVPGPATTTTSSQPAFHRAPPGSRTSATRINSTSSA